MNKMWIQGTIAGTILLSLLLLLVLRPALFVYPIWEQPYIPLGNLIFSVAFVAFPIFLRAASSRFSVPNLRARRWISRGFTVAVFLGILWWPVSFGLSGNFSNNFRIQQEFIGSSEASEWFWAYSYAIVFFPILLWLLRILLTVLGRTRGRRP